MFSIFVRSLIYNIVFYLNLGFWILLGIPTFAMPRSGILWIAKSWGRSSVWLLRVICNIKTEYRGVEKIPQGPLIVASKHQSAWETFALMPLFPDPLYILKRELILIPLFGWYAIKGDMIGVDRKAAVRSLIAMTKRARQEVMRGRQLIIFPEGTRTAVGAAPDYKSGVAQIYAECRAPCIPVALNTGLFWPRRTFMRYPGTIVAEFLDPFPPGVPRKEFTARLSRVIEEASNRLVEAGRKEQAERYGIEVPVQNPAAP